MKIRNFVVIGLIALAFVLSPVITNAQVIPGPCDNVKECIQTINLLQQLISLLIQHIQLLQKQLQPCQQPGANYNHLTGQSCGNATTTPVVSFVVTAPNGGEAWQKGTIQSIEWRWTSTETAPVEIYLHSASTWEKCPVGQTCPVGVGSYLIGKVNVPTTIFKWNVGKAWDGAVIPAGPYIVQVRAPAPDGSSLWKDQSDSYFKIYDSGQPGNLPPSISGVWGPTVLDVGKSGTWSVTASDPENGPLSYSVIWGDEGGMTAGSPASPVQQTATFTHTYSRAGTYYPTFTVTDNSGQSARTSLSVVVGGGGTQPSSITVLSPNGGESLVYGKDYTIKWGTTGFDVNADVGLRLRRFDKTNGVELYPSVIIAPNYPLSEYVKNIGSYIWNVSYSSTNGDINRNPPYPDIGTFIYRDVEQFKIEARVGGTNVSDESNGKFSVVYPTTPPPVPFADLKVNNSDGPVSVKDGETVTLSWTVPADIRPSCNITSTFGWGTSSAASGSWQVPVRFAGQTEGKVYLSCNTSVGQLSDLVKLINEIVPPSTPTITSSNPPNGAIDARSKSDTTNEINVNGTWKIIKLTFSDLLSNVQLSDFSIAASNGQMSVVSADISGGSLPGGTIQPTSVNLYLNRTIAPGERIRIIHKPSGSSVCLGFLPGDVNQDGRSNATDIGLLRSWVGTAVGASKPLYQTDINRDGVFDAADITRLSEVRADPNAGLTLPACPQSWVGLTARQSQTANVLQSLQSVLQNLKQSLER